MTDFYRAGLDHDEEEDQVGLFEYPLFSPSTVLDEMKSIKTGVDSLDRDISGGTARPVFIDSWRIFKKEWDTFYADNSGSLGDVIKRSLNTTYDKVQEYKKRLQGWRDAYKSEGGKATGPGIPEKESGGIPWKGLAWGVGILAGLAAVAMIAKEVNGTVRAIKGKEEVDGA